MYYFLSASFLWMNVMSIDICRTFHSNRYKIKSKKIFIQYSIYAWTVPLLSTVIAVFVDQFSSETFVLTPQFGTHNCWFNNKWGLVMFFTFPSGLVVLFNMVLYGSPVYDIYRQHTFRRVRSSTVRKNGPAEEEEKLGRGENERETCLKEVRHGRHGDHAPKDKSSDENRSSSGSILFIIFQNGLQGTFIFIAFDCKQKQWDERKQRFRGETPCRVEQSRPSSTETNVKTISSSGGHYTVPVSSNQRHRTGLLWYSSNAQEQAYSRPPKRIIRV
ncbi:probable G-protein coupled receptor Mth-like 1 [Penaeus indicus]|uniref:probable G-protein coupled receptor Mth-like 1 n=1 Tax=Penaeus indicus TaxID=29960 RepID=UPI00300C77C0